MSADLPIKTGQSRCVSRLQHFSSALHSENASFPSCVAVLHSVTHFVRPPPSLVEHLAKDDVGFKSREQVDGFKMRQTLERKRNVTGQ
jgi:hypothetical protein